jgi:hypothetical protein
VSALVLLTAGALFGASAAPRTVVSAGARVETRVREPAVISSNDERVGMDIDATARGSLTYGWRRSQLDVYYEPRFTYTDITGIGARDLLHSAGFTLALTARRFSLNLFQFGSYGNRWFTLTSASDVNPVTGMPVVQPLPAPTSILYISSLTGFGTRYQLTRRTGFSTQTSYGLSGGANSESQRVQPLTVGPAVSMQLDWLATRLDTVGPQVFASYTRSNFGDFRPDVVSASVGAVGFWNRSWHRTMTSSLGVGAVVVRQLDPRERTDVFPQANGLFTYATPLGEARGMLRLDANAALRSIVSPLTGTAQQTLTTSVNAAWTRRYLTLLGSLGWTRPIGDIETTRVSLLFLQAGSQYAITRRVMWELGLRYAQQSVAGFGSPFASGSSGNQVAAFTALSWNSLPLRL